MKTFVLVIRHHLFFNKNVLNVTLIINSDLYLYRFLEDGYVL